MQRQLKLKRTWSIPGLTADFPVLAATLLCILALIVLKILFDTNLHIDLLPHVVILSCMIVISPFASFYIKRMYGTLEPIVKNIIEEVVYLTPGSLVQENQTLAYQSWLSYVFPFLFGIFGFASITRMVGLPWLATPAAAISYQFLLCIFLVLAGSLGWQFFCFVMLLSQLSKVEVQRVEPFQSLKLEFKKLHGVVIGVVILAVLVYLSAIIAIWLVPWGERLLFSSSFGYFWVFPLAITVTVYFFVAEYLVHTLLRSIKYLRLQKIDSLLNIAHERWSADSSGSSVDMFGELIKWREIINQESDWAINFRGGLTVISSILLPAVGIMLDVIYQ